jgi:hypothetical protein
MSDTYGHRDTMPLTWMGRMPVYASSILVALLVTGMVLTVLLSSARIDITTFMFDPETFWKRGHIWQLLTFSLIDLPSFFYVFGLFFTYWFGVGVETFLGRRVLLRLVFLLCLVPALTASAWWLAGTPVMLRGSGDLAIGLFIAYATLYPNVELWNWITMKWLAFAGIVLNSLMYFPAHRWDLLTVFLSACAAAHVFTRYEQGHLALPRMQWPRRKPTFRVLPRGEETRRSIPRAELRDEELDSEVDDLLEKIARNGLASLSAKERARLEQARENLLKKERK